MLAQSASRLTAAAESYGAVQLEQKVFVNMITVIIMGHPPDHHHFAVQVSPAIEVVDYSSCSQGNFFAFQYTTD